MRVCEDPIKVRFHDKNEDYNEDADYKNSGCPAPHPR